MSSLSNMPLGMVCYSESCVELSDRTHSSSAHDLFTLSGLIGQISYPGSPSGWSIVMGRRIVRLVPRGSLVCVREHGPVSPGREEFEKGDFFGFATRLGPPQPLLTMPGNTWHQRFILTLTVYKSNTRRIYKDAILVFLRPLVQG